MNNSINNKHLYRITAVTRWHCKSSLERCRMKDESKKKVHRAAYKVVTHPEYWLRSSVTPPHVRRHREARGAVAKAFEDLAQWRTRTLGVSGQSEHSDPISLGHGHRHPACSCRLEETREYINLKSAEWGYGFCFFKLNTCWFLTLTCWILIVVSNMTKLLTISNLITNSYAQWPAYSCWPPFKKWHQSNYTCLFFFFLQHWFVSFPPNPLFHIDIRLAPLCSYTVWNGSDAMQLFFIIYRSK